jgi:hypothetical protein
MTTIPENFGNGGTGLQKTHGSPCLADILRGLADDANGAPTVLTGLVVATDTVTLAVKGRVLSVEATTAGTVGVKSRKLVAPPGAGEYTVAYDADGYATITFAAADSVTEAAVEVSPATYTST